MLLKSFGCSFIYGNDLYDTGIDNILLDPSRKTWPALIAQDLGYEYQCYARAGTGNLQITENILNQINCTNSVFVIGWTWIDRFDYTDQQDNCWNTLRPTTDHGLADFYYRNLHSQYRDKLSTLTNIKLIIDTLTQRNIPFVMTYMDELIFETEWHVSPAMLALQDYVRPYMVKFEDLTFLDWSKKKGFPISEALHPLELAHSEAVKVLYKQNTIDRLRLV